MKYNIGDTVFVKHTLPGEYPDLVAITDVNVVSSVGVYDYQGYVQSSRTSILFNESIILESFKPSEPRLHFSVAKLLEAHSRLLDLLK